MTLHDAHAPRSDAGSVNRAGPVTNRSDGDSVASVGAAARTGDREALRQIGSLGGKRSHERAKARKATVAAEVTLATIGDLRGFLTSLASELKAAPLDEARKASAGATVIRTIADLDGFAAMADRIKALEAELALTRALGPSDRTIKIRRPWDDTAPVAPVATEAVG